MMMKGMDFFFTFLLKHKNWTVVTFKNKNWTVEKIFFLDKCYFAGQMEEFAES